jgi:penicillin G amidase
MKSLLRFLLFIFIFLSGLAAIGIYWTFFKPLPNYSATLYMNGLEQPVDVHWDPYGVPYLYASNDNDLYFSIGYIHAQERLWQMTLSQLSAEGRFSEFLGEELIDLDIYQRTLGFWETAKQIEAEAPDELITALQKYSDGINHFIRTHKKSLPIEFALMDMEPIEWTVTHSIAITRLMAWDQNIHWWSELTYAYLEEELEPIRLQELFPRYDDRYPTTLNSSQSRGLAQSMLPLLEKEFDRRSLISPEGNQFGSNAWAVNGSKTESGLPILAGDPHMGLSIPGFWFEVHYTAPSHKITGATIPGTPFVILGQNEHIAWSITNMMADVADFFIERPLPESTELYVSDTTSAPETRSFRYRNEIIKVKDGDDRLHRVRHTENGPVISDILMNDQRFDDHLITLAWTGHTTSQEGWAIYNMNRATSIDQFENAVRDFKSPAMNFIYADKENNIALFSAANIPSRDYNPLLFRNGWDPDYSWNEMIPYEQLPKVINPQTGYVAHSNNKLHTDDYQNYIGSFWAPPSRIMRVTQFLQQSDSLTLSSMQQLQFDSFSEHARETVEIILPVLRAGNRDDFSGILPYLENWDYFYNPNSTAASIFDLFFMNLSRNTLEDELGEEAYTSLIELNYLPVQIINRMLRVNSVFFNRTDTDQSENRNDIIRLSMLETIDQLEERFGPEPIEWRWENLNTITLRPPLLGEASDSDEAPAAFKMIVQNLFNKGPYPVHGHGMSVNKSEYNWNRPFQVNVGPSIRRIVDFSSPGRSLSVLPTGQSGNPVSTHYGDQTELWLDGRYRYIYQDSTFFQQTSYQTMQFVPAEFQ